MTESATNPEVPAALAPKGDGVQPGEGHAHFRWEEVERATGSPTHRGNLIRLQFEGSITFDAWIEAIDRAQAFVYFENYVVRDDRVGRAFREALINKARQGVPVFVIYDWVGCWATPRAYWKPMREAGVHIRAFNPPSLALGDPLGVLQRDHRKLVVVDGEAAFVGGFCVGEEWAGGATRAPWRDTGLEIRGPAARAAALAFERLWGEMGESISLASTLPVPEGAGPSPVWIIEGEPGKARVYRTLHLTAAKARQRIWITDAYFVAPRSVSEALAAAAWQGVDVRILVPAHSNWPWVRSISRGGYRFLLENGVRVFEWQGPMMHAKTTVADGVWSRVGSSNLNSASLMGNWEIDVGVLDQGFGSQLEGLFLADLASSREIVLPARIPVGTSTRTPGERSMPTESLDSQGTLQERLARMRSRGAGRLGMAPLVRAGSALGGALAGNRPLGREDRTVLGTLSIGILLVAILAGLFPTIVGWTVAAAAFWFGAAMGIRAFAQARRGRAEEREGVFYSKTLNEERETAP
ncbi:MAG TPA: phospholipase D-like domain-containing protein [Longimicrobiales bacterium]|nr:phospholipase D-like domain-containing protein [Longimicrobiales bacterium]